MFFYNKKEQKLSLTQKMDRKLLKVSDLFQSDLSASDIIKCTSHLISNEQLTDVDLFKSIIGKHKGIGETCYKNSDLQGLIISCMHQNLWEHIDWLIYEKLSIVDVKEMDLLSTFSQYEHYDKVNEYIDKGYSPNSLWLGYSNQRFEIKDEYRIILKKLLFDPSYINNAWKIDALCLLKEYDLISYALKNIVKTELIEPLDALKKEGFYSIKDKIYISTRNVCHYFPISWKNEGADLTHDYVKELCFNHRPTIKFFYDNMFKQVPNTEIYIPNIHLFKILYFYAYHKNKLPIPDPNIMYKFISETDLSYYSLREIDTSNYGPGCFGELDSRQQVKLLKLINNCNDDDIIKDTLSLLKDNWRGFAPWNDALKFKSLEESHNYLVDKKQERYIREQEEYIRNQEIELKNRKKKFNYQDFIYPNFKDFHNKKMMDYTFFIPSGTRDLIEGGSKLSICVGNLDYENSMKNKKSAIFFLKKNNAFSHCIEIKKDLDTRFYIKQAVSYKNTPIEPILKKQLIKEMKLKY